MLALDYLVLRLAISWVDTAIFFFEFAILPKWSDSLSRRQTPGRYDAIWVGVG